MNRWSETICGCPGVENTSTEVVWCDRVCLVWPKGGVIVFRLVDVTRCGVLDLKRPTPAGLKGLDTLRWMFHRKTLYLGWLSVEIGCGTVSEWPRDKLSFTLSNTVQSESGRSLSRQYFHRLCRLCRLSGHCRGPSRSSGRNLGLKSRRGRGVILLGDPGPHVPGNSRRLRLSLVTLPFVWKVDIVECDLHSRFHEGPDENFFLPWWTHEGRRSMWRGYRFRFGRVLMLNTSFVYIPIGPFC